MTEPDLFEDDHFEHLAAQHTSSSTLEIPELDEEQIKWELKGEKEVYIEKLEARLKKAKERYQPPIPPPLNQTKKINDPQDVPLLSTDETDDAFDENIERGITQRLYDPKSGNVIIDNDSDDSGNEEEDSPDEESEEEYDNEDENKYIPVTAENPFQQEFEDEEQVQASFPQDDDFEVSFPEEDEEEIPKENKIIFESLSSLSITAPSWAKEDQDISSLVARLNKE
jgi:hypothetical protein